MAGYVKEDFDDRTCAGDDRPVEVELVCGSITSSNLTEIATFGLGTAPAPDVGQFIAEVTVNNPNAKYFNSSDHGHNVMQVTKDSILCTMKAVRSMIPDAENRGSGVRESDPENTDMKMLKKFRIPAFGTTFAGLKVSGPVIYEETNGLPVPLPC